MRNLLKMKVEMLFVALNVGVGDLVRLGCIFHTAEVSNSDTDARVAT